MQLLHERGEFASRHGSGAFAILLMQDLSVVPLLTLVPLLSNTAAIVTVPLWEQLLILFGMFLLLWVFGSKIVPLALEFLARHDNRDAFLLVVLLAVFLAAWAMHQAGLSMALGAFIMGMLLSGSRYNMQIRAHIEPYKGLLMSLFFVAVGMSIDIGELAEYPLEFLGHTAALIGIKLAVLFPLAIAFGYSRANAVRMTFLLAQAGEFGFVLFGSALVLDVIDESTFVMAVGVISLSMLLTPFMVNIGYWLADRMERSDEPKSGKTEAIQELSEQQVLIGGYGRVGHTVATLLKASGKSFVAFDTDPERVQQGRSHGQAVMYGDISDPEILAAIHAERASLIVLTVHRSTTALRTVAHLRNAYPQVPVIARARDLEKSSILLRAGATEVFPEAIEASLRLGAKALEMAGAPSDDVDNLIQSVRNSRYELVQHDTKSPGN